VKWRRKGDVELETRVQVQRLGVISTQLAGLEASAQIHLWLLIALQLV
jgi:hypothetical protein